MADLGTFAEGWKGDNLLIEDCFVEHSFFISPDRDNEDIEGAQFRMIEVINALLQGRFFTHPKEEREGFSPVRRFVSRWGGTLDNLDSDQDCLDRYPTLENDIEDAVDMGFEDFAGDIVQHNRPANWECSAWHDTRFTPLFQQGMSGVLFLRRCGVPPFALPERRRKP